MFIVVLKYAWLKTITEWIGATTSTTTLFFGSLIFLMLMSVQFCIMISKLSGQLKDLSQENALLRKQIETLARRFGTDQKGVILANEDNAGN